MIDALLAAMKKDTGDPAMSENIYRHLCIIALVFAISGVALQQLIGGIVAGLVAAVASLLGFIAGYRWHQSRTNGNDHERGDG